MQKTEKDEFWTRCLGWAIIVLLVLIFVMVGYFIVSSYEGILY